MNNRFFLLPLIILGCAGASAQEPVDLEPYRAASVKRWEQEIAKLEALDQQEKHPADSILFVGSSSIRMWSGIADDMAPYHPIQRGFGGSKWPDVAIFADRLITPHQYRAAVFFVANDITGGKDDKSPEQVAALFAQVRQQVRKHNPDAQVFAIAITPTPSRWAAWPTIRKANMAVRRYCEETKDTWFIGTESIYLDAAGQPRPELFRDDKLHMNPDGYLRWAAAIKSQLDSVLGGAGEPVKMGVR
jgi:hypothetical protein